MLKAVVVFGALCLLLVYGTQIWELTQNAEARAVASDMFFSTAKSVSKDISSYELNVDIKKKALSASSRSSEEAKYFASLFD